MAEAHRYLGLELSGAKNQKTSIAALEYYPREKKIFLLDIYDRITCKEDQTSDQALLESIEEVRSGAVKLGVNVPLELPPCIQCSLKACQSSKHCQQPAVKWMRSQTRRAEKSRTLDLRVKDFTPYTQRPIELWVRYEVLPELPEHTRFEIDETLGGNKAPLTARMHFLKKHIRGLELVEVWPKLTVAVLACRLALSKRQVSVYRNLEEGAQARLELLETLAREGGIFIYDRDLRKLAHSLTAFDAFICAYTALLSDLEECARPPHSFPLSTGWIVYPKIKASGSKSR